MNDVGLKVPTTARFTPGPWRTERPAHAYGEGERIDIYATGEMVAACNRIPFRAAANARLIAAAPELYEALNNMVSKCGAGTTGCERVTSGEWYDAAVLALAKVDGR